MVDYYKTIVSISKGYFIVKRSRFISFAVPVQNREEIKKIIENYLKQYHNARHICWAYRLGEEIPYFRMYDDGEPSSVAGKPILNVIDSFGLTNILIIVIRYFGGIKLGTSGLITAYKTAAFSALEKTEIIEKTSDEILSISFEYPFIGVVMNIVKKHHIQMISQEIGIFCRMVLSFPKSQAEAVKVLLMRIGSMLFSPVNQ